MPEKHGLVASHMPPTVDLAYNPGLYPDRELSQQPFGSQASSQSTELHQPGHNLLLTLTNGDAFYLLVIILADTEMNGETPLQPEEVLCF